MPDLIASLEDGAAEIDIDALFANAAADLDRFQLLSRVAHFEHCLQPAMPTPPMAHPSARREGPHKHVKVNSKTLLEVPGS